MEGTRIVLVRHGESVAQEQGFVGGHDGCTGLSERGREQVTRLRDRLERTGELRDASALYASVMSRAVESAGIIAPAVGDHDVVQECDFCEHHPGEGDGLKWGDYDARFPAPDAWDPDLRRAPGSETWNEMGVRIARGLDSVLERHAGETVVIACHGGVIVHSMMRFLGLTPGGAGRAWMSPENSSITEWRWSPNPYSKSTLPVELVRFNDHAHLL